MPPSTDPADLLKRRAHRLAGKGEFRKAALALRERAAIVGDAAAWVMAGAMLRRAHREGEAVVALRHGLWLHQRAGDLPKARSVAMVLEDIEPGSTASFAKKLSPKRIGRAA